MKILALATSSIAFTGIISVTLFTKLYSGIDPLNWLTFLAVSGPIYIFFQNLGIAQTKSGDTMGPAIDIGFSVIPIFALFFGLLSGSGDFRAYIIFGVVLICDLPNIFTSLKMLGLSSEITPGSS